MKNRLLGAMSFIAFKKLQQLLLQARQLLVAKYRHVSALRAIHSSSKHRYYQSIITIATQ